uniref:Uncharacterized protein n=1 Tax=Neobacillus citreus TaxID=2833578 RepID=A0A942T0D4_9BACI
MSELWFDATAGAAPSWFDSTAADATAADATAADATAAGTPTPPPLRRTPGPTQRGRVR